MITTHLDVHLTPADLRATLITDARRGLTATPKTLPAEYFYDARGSELFERDHRDCPSTTRPAPRKPSSPGTPTRWPPPPAPKPWWSWDPGRRPRPGCCWTPWPRPGGLRRYVPVDVSASALGDGARRCSRVTTPVCEVHGVVADFEAHLDRLPTPTAAGRLPGQHDRQPRAGRAVAFLPGPARRAGHRRRLPAGGGPGQGRARLVAAYDDAAGVTADFNRNVLRVLNASLGADFDPRGSITSPAGTPSDGVDGDGPAGPGRMTVTLPRSGPPDRLRRRRGDPDRDLGQVPPSGSDRRAGWRRFQRVTSWWTDPAGDFALALSVPDL